MLSIAYLPPRHWNLYKFFMVPRLLRPVALFEEHLGFMGQPTMTTLVCKSQGLLFSIRKLLLVRPQCAPTTSSGTTDTAFNLNNNIAIPLFLHLLSAILIYQVNLFNPVLLFSVFCDQTYFPIHKIHTLELSNWNFSQNLNKDFFYGATSLIHSLSRFKVSFALQFYNKNFPLKIPTFS